MRGGGALNLKLLSMGKSEEEGAKSPRSEEDVSKCIAAPVCLNETTSRIQYKQHPAAGHFISIICFFFRCKAIFRDYFFIQIVVLRSLFNLKKL